MGISAQLVLASRSTFATQSKSHRLKYVIMTDTASKYAVKLKTNFDDPKWINRHKFMFNFLDINGNGKITLDEIVSKASDDICAKLGATPAQTQRHQDAVEAFFKKIGMDYGKEVEFPEFVEGWRNLAKHDLKLWSQNKKSLIRDWGEAVFDIFDKDGSGSISLDEWKAYGRVSGICPSDEDAEQTFKHCDSDNIWDSGTPWTHKLMVSMATLSPKKHLKEILY